MKYYGFTPIKPSCPGRGDEHCERRSGPASPDDAMAHDAAAEASAGARSPGPEPPAAPPAEPPGPRPGSTGRWWFASVGQPVAIQQTEAARVELAHKVSAGKITFGHYVAESDGAYVGAVRPAPLGVRMLPAAPGPHVAILIDSDPPVLLFAAPAWAPAKVPALAGCEPRVLGGAA